MNSDDHTDIDARDALVKALAAFEGAVLLISHDPYLVDLVADRLLLVADGRVTALEGDLESYSASVTGAAPAREANPRRNDKNDRKERSEARCRTAPLRQAAKAAEQRLAKLTAERQMLEKQLADPRLYGSGNAKDIAYINQRIKAIKRDTDIAEQDWLAAEAALEAAI